MTYQYGVTKEAVAGIETSPGSLTLELQPTLGSEVTDLRETCALSFFYMALLF